MFLNKRILYTLFILSPFIADAQRTADVSADYTYILGDNEDITIRQARLIAIEMARAEAIKKEFGVTVNSDQITGEIAIDDKETSMFMFEAQSSVQGEWLGDSQQPQVTISTDGQNMMFTAHVSGKAREILRGATDLKWQVMTEDESGHRYPTDVFNSGQRLYVDFRSPIDGYVAVYLVSPDGSTSCLLPYPKDGTGLFKIRHNTNYTFFDRSSDYDPTVKYYKLSTDKLQEYNQLCIIFSPNPFTKCLDRVVDPRKPNALSYNDFSKWLLQQQRNDKDMTVRRKWLQIKST